MYRSIEFQIVERTVWRQKEMSKKLRKFIKDGGSGERWIHVQLPLITEHKNHPIGNVRAKLFITLK